MQHLDEGTIHSWLDGALTADEAARVEAHVKECPQCAAAVAEARGFIAGSSRILTALDNAPRGVIPAAAPKRRVDPLVWRIAATVLVVAAGTLVVVRNRGSNAVMSGSIVDSSVVARPTSVSEGAATAMEAVPAPVDQTAAKTPANKSPAVAFSGKGVTRSSPSGPEKGGYKALRQNVIVERDLAAAAEGAVKGAAAAVPAGARRIASPSVAASAAMDAAAEPEQLKVVGTPRRVGAKVTLYEVTPGDTVTLTESVPTLVQGVVTSAGVAMQPQTARKSVAQSRARTDVAVPAAADSQPAASAPLSAGAVSAPAPAPAFGMVTALNTLTWKDPVTGATLTLTGRLSTERLQEIKIRIERERAAASAKRTP